MKMRKFMGGRDLVQDLTEAQIRAAGRKAGEALRKIDMDAQFREMPEMVSQEWLVAHSKNPNHGKAKFRETSITFQQ